METRIKERGVIFKSEMVNAIIRGNKTQTRRIMKGFPDVQHGWYPDRYNNSEEWTFWGPRGSGDAGRCTLPFVKCPFGEIGDRLWVREAYRMPESLDQYSPSTVADLALNAGYRDPWAPIQLEADGARIGKWAGFDTPPVVTETGKLRPSLHMPRWASRITLEITGVRVERLNSINGVDAKAEGYPAEREADGGHHDAWLWYRSLWESIYGEESWQANPWVWVIEFKRLEAVP